MIQTFRFNDDASAWAHLHNHGFKETRGGMIYHPDLKYKFASGDSEALDELCNEWDYGWAGIGHPDVVPPYNNRSTANVPDTDGEPLVG